jgi:hypothetical protein
MPKARSEDLFRLVSSLSASEKRSFTFQSERLSGSERPKFLRLFDVLCKMKVYDEAIIRQKLPIYLPGNCPI